MAAARFGNLAEMASHALPKVSLMVAHASTKNALTASQLSMMSVATVTATASRSMNGLAESAAVNTEKAFFMPPIPAMTMPIAPRMPMNTPIPLATLIRRS